MFGPTVIVYVPSAASGASKTTSYRPATSGVMVDTAGITPGPVTSTSVASKLAGSIASENSTTTDGTAAFTKPPVTDNTRGPAASAGGTSKNGSYCT